ncbi:hypothetical protein Ancab_037187 [Ancistrocladus abbreviatus]
MERHRCKLCFRSFASGRALGGHMRSHMMSLAIPPKPQPRPPPPPSWTRLDYQDEYDTESASSSSSPSSTSSSSSEDEENEEKGLSYRMRENPKRSIRSVDPEFSFAAAATGSSSIILQDKESETESSKNNPTRRRSKRKDRNFTATHHQNNQIDEETEPASSISEDTPEEDIAFCLMMLSCDNWNSGNNNDNKENTSNKFKKLRTKDRLLHFSNRININDDDIDDSEELMDFPSSRKNTNTDSNSNGNNSSSRGGKYKCDTCKKVFRSYQALGGHRASHKKIRALREGYDHEGRNFRIGDSSVTVKEKKIHECPVCFRVFASGQALGGHKRSHVIGVEDQPELTIKGGENDDSPRKISEKLIDLNLPAPIEEDEISHIALSVVSDDNL